MPDEGRPSCGALSRWRTLHEHSVIAMFLKMHGSEAAHRYLVSFDFQALKSARQMREYAYVRGLNHRRMLRLNI
jgi:hypothetical protein